MQSSSFVWICYRRCHHHFKNIQTGVTNNSLSPNLVAKISTDFHSDLGTTLMRVSFSPELRWWGQPPPSPPRWSSLSPPSCSSSSSSLTSSKILMKSPSFSCCWRAGSVLLSLCHFVFKLSLNCLLALRVSCKTSVRARISRNSCQGLFSRQKFCCARFVFPSFPRLYLAIVGGIPIEQIGNLKNKKGHKMITNSEKSGLVISFSKDNWLHRHVDESCTAPFQTTAATVSSQILWSMSVPVLFPNCHPTTGKCIPKMAISGWQEIGVDEDENFAIHFKSFRRLLLLLLLQPRGTAARRRTAACYSSTDNQEISHEKMSTFSNRNPQNWPPEGPQGLREPDSRAVIFTNWGCGWNLEFWRRGVGRRCVLGWQLLGSLAAPRPPQLRKWRSL